MDKHTKFKELPIKEKLSFGLCLVFCLLGVGITVAGFIVPPMGAVSDSVLIVLGQCILFIGAIIGINQHYTSQSTQFQNNIIEFLKRNKITSQSHEEDLEMQRVNDE